MSYITLFQTSIPLQIKRSRRKSLALYVHIDKIEVRVPWYTSSKTIEDWVEEKHSWICRNWQKLKDAEQPTPNTLYYLGEAIDYQHTPSALRTTHYDNQTLWCYCRHASQSKALIDAWYQQQAETIFEQRLQICFKQMQHLNITYPQLKIRKMKARWGSCSAQGVITLNKNLIAQSIECIDYVITHELCHLLEFNHSKRFYALMESVMPKWKKYKARLRKLKISI